MTTQNKPQQTTAALTPTSKPGGCDFVSLLQAPKGSVEFVPFGGNDRVKLSIAIVQNLVAVKTKTGRTCSDADALKFIAMCQARKMNPFEGDCYMIGYDGKDGPQFALITAHQTYLKRAELHPEFDGMQSGLILRQADGSILEAEGDFFESEQQLLGGWARVFFKNRSKPMYKRLRLDRFKKPFGIWQEDPAGMICKCAEADALRSSFPTMLGGLYLREELGLDGGEKTPVRPDFASGGGRPLFSAPSDVPGNGGKTDVPAQVEDTKPEPSHAEKLRSLCKKSRIEEGLVLDWLASTGASDGSASLLEELQPEVMEKLIADWQSASGQMLAYLEGLK